MNVDAGIGPPARPLQRADGLILILHTPKGRGVFASKRIHKGTVIEVSPVLVLTAEEVEKHTSQTCLQHYTYNWPSSEGSSSTQAVALGLGSMFNHSNQKQNVVWNRDMATQCIIFEARNDIEVGEELCISYGNTNLWFKDADAADANDDWAHLHAAKQDLSNTSEIEISGIGQIEL